MKCTCGLGTASSRLVYVMKSLTDGVYVYEDNEDFKPKRILRDTKCGPKNRPDAFLYLHTVFLLLVM